jgi:hypothetical protein
MSARATAALLTVLLLVPASAPGQSDDRPPASGERFTLVEHVRVAGSCVEDRGGEAAQYTGFVDRWHDGKKNRDLLQGSVTNFERLSPGRPKTLPPAAIEFGEIAANQLAGNRVVLKGFTSGNREPCVALVIGAVAGIRLTRQQVRRTAAPLLLAPAFLLQLVSLLLP